LTESVLESKPPTSPSLLPASLQPIQTYVSRNSTHMKVVMDTAGLYMDGKYKYSGEWNKDTMHGTGKFIYASGTTYDGQWDNSEYHGTGTFSWPDGRHYEVQAKSVRV